MTPDEILLDAQERMDKAINHLHAEFRGVRTGRASAALVEYIKVDYYGSLTDLKSIAAISVPEATQLLIKPFDATAVSEIKKAIESSDLGLNPQTEGKQIRIEIPALSSDRRKQLAGHIKKLGEDAKVALRNVRRDANRHADALKKNDDAKYSEDELETLKKETQDIIKEHEKKIETMIADKTKEIMAV